MTEKILKNRALNYRWCIVFLILMFSMGVIMAGLASAAPVTDAHGIAATGSDTAGNYKTGFNITAVYDEAILQITKYTGTVATKCYVYNAAQTLLETASFVGNTCTLAGTTILSAERQYYILIDAEGANHNINYSGIVSMPIAGTNIIWNRGCYNNFLQSSEPTSIVSITTNVTSYYTYLINLSSPSNNSAISDVGANFTANFSITGYAYFNYTWRNLSYYLWNSTGLFNQSMRNFAEPFLNDTNYTLYMDDFTLGTYKWTAVACYSNATFTNCTSAGYNFTFDVGAALINITYNNQTYETASETFSASFNILQNSHISLAQFVYNTTIYNITNITITPTTMVLSKKIDIPLNLNPYANTSNNFYFKFTFGDGFIQSTSQYQQNVSFINLGLCNATYTTTAMNLTVNNESVPLARINTFYFGGFFGYWRGGGNVKKNSTILNSSVAKEIPICIYPPYVNLSLNADIDYSADAFSMRSYYIRNGQISNITNNISLYLLNSTLSESVIINVKDKYLTVSKNHFVKVLKYYPGLGAYYFVETAKTDDFGNAIVKVQLEDIDYRIQIENSTGYQIYSSNPMRIICTATPCSLNFITGVTEHVMQQLIDFSNVQYSLTWNNNTKYVNFEFSDSSGLTQSMRLYVVKLTGYGEVSICDNLIEGSAGISSCYIGNQTGEFSARVYRTASPLKYFAQLGISLAETWKNFGVEGLVWMFLFAIVMFFAGLTVGPSIAAVMSAGSIIFMMATGIVYMPLVVVISIVAVVIIFIAKMRD